MKLSTAALRFAGLLYVVLCLPAVALADQAAVPFADEVNSCVDAIYDRLDLTTTDRIRHVVTKEKRTGIGYALAIQTTVYFGAEQRSYSVYCVASGRNAPTKFRFELQPG